MGSEQSEKSQSEQNAVQAHRIDRLEVTTSKLSHRLSTLEEKALYIPNAEESDLIKEAAAFYKAKRQFREKLATSLVEKGVTGLVIFVVTASFFYLKHILTEGP